VLESVPYSCDWRMGVLESVPYSCDWSRGVLEFILCELSPVL